MKFALLVGAAVAPLLLGGTAVAQQSDQVDDVVVTGRRPIAESEAAAIRIQRESDSLISVVAADSVGRLPDQNIAFAVGRLPGVGIQRDQGQARYVNLRGAPTNWTTLSFDGINVVSPEGRSSRFDNIPSALAAQIVANKAVTPDMSAESLAGNIDIITRSAFDYPGFKLNGKLGGGIGDLGGGLEVDSSFVISDRFFDDRFGALFSASYYTREMFTDNIETDWEPVSEDRAQPGSADRPLWGREHENKLYRLTRTNRSFSGRLEYRPDDANTVFLSSIFTEYRDDELRSNIKIDLDDRQSSTPITACSARPNAGRTVSGGASGYADACTGNTPFQGTVFGVDFDNNFNDLESIEFISTTTLGGNHLLGGWDLQWRLNYTKTDDGSNAPALTSYASPSTRTLRPTVVYDFRNPEAQRMEFYRTIQNPDGTYARGERVLADESFATELFRLQRREGGAETDAYTAILDVEREASLFGRSTTFKFGGEYAERTKRSENVLYEITTNDIIAAGLPRTFAAIAIDGPYSGEIPLGYNFRYHGSVQARALLDQAIASGRGTTRNNFNYEVTEEAMAAYAMATVDFDWGNIVFGARVERTENTGEAPTTLRLAPVPPATVGVSSSVITTSASEETMVFPSVHFNWDVADNKKVRFSVNTGAARPDYDDLRPGFSVDDALQTASGGNPAATPEKAVGADAYFEWYFNTGGLFQMGAFYKEIEDVLFDSSTTLGPVDFPDGIDRSNYTLSTLVNGFEGQITGFEIAYQQSAKTFVESMGLPAWLGGFGIQANATITDSEAVAPDGRTVRLPGTSDLIYNVIPYYENYGFSARLSYQYRTEWLDSVGLGGIAASNGGDQFWDDDAELDFSMRYSINDNVEWYFDASNLTNGRGIRYSTEKRFTIENETFGARYLMGVRVQF
ncbi:MAG: TonB-dependent receptor [Brevundimonas sp.]|uniref:TonB-dependent receptor n=1 Tax=Brevundimonas sp. TaxID=1871086 RepID=UPI002732FFDB|nr:TonB-dependent receptor [Brevundimonas sp.]MDP3405005.1 TonB-dependent receptor [Brevundimonas sp.]